MNQGLASAEPAPVRRDDGPRTPQRWYVVYRIGGDDIFEVLCDDVPEAEHVRDMLNDLDGLTVCPGVLRHAFDWKVPEEEREEARITVEERQCASAS